MASQLTDAFARKFYYLRLSITDVCNFRCTYCLPDGYKPSGVTNKGFLTVDEIRRVTRAFASLGTEKVRLTGGEPSLRRDFTDIIAAVRENDAIRQIAVTTNGYRLERDVANWRDAKTAIIPTVSNTILIRPRAKSFWLAVSLILAKLAAVIWLLSPISFLEMSLIFKSMFVMSPVLASSSTVSTLLSTVIEYSYFSLSKLSLKPPIDVLRVVRYVLPSLLVILTV